MGLGSGSGLLPPGSNPVSYTHLDVYKRQVYDTFLDNIQEDFAKREGLLFVGGFAHPPNADACLLYTSAGSGCEGSEGRERACHGAAGI